MESAATEFFRQEKSQEKSGGIVMWQDGEDVGLEFDRPLSDACFAATRDFAPEIFREAARAFVAGMDGIFR
jgi:hypothetical protein